MHAQGVCSSNSDKNLNRTNSHFFYFNSWAQFVSAKVALVRAGLDKNDNIGNEDPSLLDSFATFCAWLDQIFAYFIERFVWPPFLSVAGQCALLHLHISRYWPRYLCELPSSNRPLVPNMIRIALLALLAIGNMSSHYHPQPHLLRIIINITVLCKTMLLVFRGVSKWKTAKVRS